MTSTKNIDLLISSRGGKAQRLTRSLFAQLRRFGKYIRLDDRTICNSDILYTHFATRYILFVNFRRAMNKVKLSTVSRNSLE